MEADMSKIADLKLVALAKTFTSVLSLIFLCLIVHILDFLDSKSRKTKIFDNLGNMICDSIIDKLWIVTAYNYERYYNKTKRSEETPFMEHFNKRVLKSSNSPHSVRHNEKEPYDIDGKYEFWLYGSRVSFNNWCKITKKNNEEIVHS